MKNYINHNSFLSKPLYICGVMTGTSLDGIDAALVKFETNENGKHKFEMISYLTLEFPDEIKNLILRIINEPVTINDVSFVNFALPQLYAQAIKEACQTANFNLHNLDAVGIHGQTVWHQPTPIAFGGIVTASTFQLGSPSVLANILGVPVIGDFRAADIALGGQGAPLVPIFDYEFLGSESEDRIALNIGGIANITVLQADCKKEDMRAWDTGPGNVLIDTCMNLFYQKKYDNNGEFARKGKIIELLHEILKGTEYIRQMPPKSTGRELFNEELIKEMIKSDNPSNSVITSPPAPLLSKERGEKNDYTTISHQSFDKWKINELNAPLSLLRRGAGGEVSGESLTLNYNADIIHTMTAFTAWSIAENIRLFANPSSTIIVSGGGSENGFLMELLHVELPQSKIIKSDSLGIPSDAKEAICFTYLAYRTLCGLPGNMPSVTGAKKEALLGTISLPY